jgi:hypothetical protein
MALGSLFLAISKELLAKSQGQGAGGTPDVLRFTFYGEDKETRKED